MQKDVFDELVVVKRSGQRVNFNSYKIAVAIKNAFDSVYDNSEETKINKIYENVLKYIEINYANRKTINVEDIQDIIESKLEESNFKEVYNAFSEYRKKRAASRKIFTQKQQHKFLKAIEKINDDNILLNDNSCKIKDIVKNYGLMVVNEITKSYIIDNKFLREHEEGNIYINDMCDFSLGRLSNTHINLNNFLENNSFENVVYKLKDLSTEISGEINVPSLDKLLENYSIKKFKLLYIEYLSNYLKVSGFDKYINLKKIIELINKEKDITFDMSNYSIYMLSEQVENIFDSAYKDAYEKCKSDLYYNLKKMFEDLSMFNKSYSFSFGTNDSSIGNCINKTLLEVLNELGRLNNVIVIFKLNEDNASYMSEICSLIINNKNVMVSNNKTSYNKGNNEVEYFSDGVRIYENNNEDVSSSEGRMVVALTNINFARLGLEFENDNIKNFYNKLDFIVEIVKSELLLSFETIGNKNKDNYEFVFNNNIMSDDRLERGQKIRKIIKNGNLLIGLIGLNECVQLLEKDSTKQYELLKGILKFLNKKCMIFREETKLNFYLYEPYKSAASKELIALDKSIYGNRKELKNKCMYDLISNLPEIKNNYSLIGEIQKLVSGGSILEIKVNKNMTVNKLEELIFNIFDSDVGFLKFITKDVT